MLTWNSRSSFWTDMLFGAFPAALLGLYSLYVFFMIVGFNNLMSGNESQLNIFLLAVSFFGFTSSLSLLYTSFARARSRFKLWMQISLSLGLCCAGSVVGFFYFFVGWQRDLQIFLIPITCVVAIALKHIRLLARGGTA